jgi:type I restriction enzyme M protein
VRAEAQEEEEEEGLDEKMLHLTAKLERQFAESAKLEAMIRENLRWWSYGN